MVGRDPNLVLFLRHLQRQVYLPGDPIAFVADLHHRWGERHPARPAAVVPAPSAPTPMAVAPGTVFLSYASQDRVAVLTLKAALEAAGIAVFFDQHSIPPGADWERQIRTVVRDCGLFLPFVSRHAAERDEGWFLKSGRSPSSAPRG
jgi:TIR domain-containing protein